MILKKNKTDLTKYSPGYLAKYNICICVASFLNTRLKKLHKQHITISATKRKHTGQIKASTCRE